MSNYKHFSKIYILVRVIALLFHCALFVWRACVRQRTFRTKSLSLAENHKAEVCALLTATLKYFHGFLTCTDGEYACEM